MKGSIRKIGTGWNVTIDTGKDAVTGKRIQKRKSGFKKEKDAQAYINNFIRDLEDGVETGTPSTFKQLTDEFLKTKKPVLAPKTYSSYKTHIDIYFNPVFGALKLDEIKPNRIEKYINGLFTKNGKNGKRPLSATSIRYQYTVLHKLFSQAVTWKYLRSNPCDSVQAPQKSEVTYNLWTIQDYVQALKTMTDSLIFPHLYLATITGMRIGEICGLKWSDIDFETGLVTVSRQQQTLQKELIFRETTKGKKTRTIIIDMDDVSTLKAIKAKQSANMLRLGDNYIKNYTGYFSVWDDGSFMVSDYVGKKFAKEIKEYGLPKTRFHDLRHLNATLLIASGVDFKTIQTRLGHADIGTTMNVYGHVDIENQKKAIAQFSTLMAAAKSIKA